MACHLFGSKPFLGQHCIFQIKKVMKDCVDVIDILSELLLKTKLPGDPDDIMPYEHMTLIVSKQHGRDLSNLLYTTDYGAIQFPDTVFINTVPFCVESKVCMRPFQELLLIPWINFDSSMDK